MKYWVPDLLLATQLPPQQELEDKLGGLPWGLPENLWPACRSCGNPQSLLAQFIHHADRLDLGAEGRVLFVFQCNYDPGQCPTWEGGGGSNACLILPRDALTSKLAAPPRGDVKLETEARVRRWLEHDDGIPEDLYRSFIDDKSIWSLPEGVTDKVATGTKLGGAPAWLQGADEGSGQGWRFVGQLDSTYSFYSPVPTPDVIGCHIGRKVDGQYIYDKPAKLKAGAPDWAFVDEEQYEGRSWLTEGPNFGDGGIGYIFVRTTAGATEGWFFWQCL
jgi:hypothetical protein